MLGAIDIGGTKIAVAVGSPDGGLRAAAQFDTDPAGAAAPQVDAALSRLTRLAEDARVELTAVGVGCPGPYDRVDRRLLTPPNMPGWHGFDLGGFLDAQLACPLRIMNDANAAALAEHRWGGHDSDWLVYLTHSTGFGAGIIAEGRLLEGARGFAGEVGRIALERFGPAGFGAIGTAEAFASGSGLAQLAELERRRCAQAGQATALAHARTITAQRVCELAAAGDTAAKRVTDISAEMIGRLAAILVNVLEPQVIVLGTIAAAHPALFIPKADREMRRHATPEALSRVRLVASALRDRGLLGALAAAASISPHDLRP